MLPRRGFRIALPGEVFNSDESQGRRGGALQIGSAPGRGSGSSPAPRGLSPGRSSDRGSFDGGSVYDVLPVCI
jgi:hypothetical protein